MQKSAISAPEIECLQVLPSLFVNDVSNAVDFYVGRLGFRHLFNYGNPVSKAGVGLGSVVIPGHGAGQISFVVSDLVALYEFHKTTGVEIIEEIKTLNFGIRTYTIVDAYGNYINFRNYVRKTAPVIDLTGKN
jgi:uncharacterized glyoxalase superfamily protein PhnB